MIYLVARSAAASEAGVLAALFGAGFLTLLFLGLLALLVNASLVFLAARLTGLRGRFKIACKTTLLGWLLALAGGAAAGMLVRLVWPGLAWPVGLVVVVLFGTVAVRTCYRTTWLRALITHLATALMTALILTGFGTLGYRLVGADRLAEIGRQLGAEDVPTALVQKVKNAAEPEAAEEPMLIATPLSRASDHIGQQVVLTLADGRTASGRLLQVDEGSLVLEEELAGGSMSIVIDLEDVLELLRVVRQ